MKPEPPEPTEQRLFRALAHPVRIQILEILAKRVASPRMLAGELGTDLRQVSYHTHALESCGCLALVETAGRRGAGERFYKVKPEAFTGRRAWRRVRQTMRGGITAASLQAFTDKALGALEAGTTNKREDTSFETGSPGADAEGAA